MTAAAGAQTRRRSALAAALSAALLLAGLLLTVATSPVLHDIGLPPVVVLGLLLPAYVIAHHFVLEFEFRRESHGITLVQLPLALGVQLVAPLGHLAVRLLATCIGEVFEGRGRQKALYNMAAAAFEVGAASFAVGLVGDRTGPVLWLALWVGLVTGDVVGAFVLNAVWRVMGVPVGVRHALRTLAAAAPVGLLFTALAVVAVTAVRVEPLAGVVMLVVALGLTLAFRSYRRMSAHAETTEQLYAFVKELGPLALDSPQATNALQSVRTLLHAERLDLVVPDAGRWWHLQVAEDREPHRTESAAPPPGAQIVAGRPPALARRRAGRDDTMTTALPVADGALGILTATGRLGVSRGFDMSDLRLLEATAAELATALERGRLHADLERSASVDPLTGLATLPELTRRLGTLISDHRRVVLAAVAVESFREVNDTLGHQVGDQLLCEVSRRLRLLGPDALVARIGGGRFAVAVPADKVGGDGEMFALRLRAQVEGPAQLGAVGSEVRLSVGVVLAPEHGTEAATLLRRAETAMYAGRSVRGGPVLWQPAYEVRGHRRLAVVTALREALAREAIGVAYQPKIEVATGRVTGVEVLARWTHPALGVVSPVEFVPLAEAGGLMGALTSTVLHQGLTACRSWQQRAPGVGVAVNVSADTVLDPGFAREVAALLEETGVPPALLVLELTEGVVVSDPQMAVLRMSQLRELGLTLSVDDFGTGYSSLTYLKGLPVNEVKIDKGFIDGLVDDSADRAVVRAVVDIGHAMRLNVVAEGVERQEQQDVLQHLGVDTVQGYLHARPMPEAELAGWLQARRLLA